MKKLIFITILNVFMVITFAQGDTLVQPNSKEYFISILKKNNQSSYANYGLGCLYFSQSNYKEAIRYCKKNIKTNNEYCADSYIIIATSEHFLGRSNKSISTLEEALKKFPDNYKIIYQYAFINYLYRNYDDIINVLEKSISKAPLYAPMHYLYGISLFEKSNTKECIAPLLYALLLDTISERSQNVIFFIDNYLNKKYNNIQIPFFEKRLNLASADNILSFFSSKEINVKTTIDAIKLIELIEAYLKDTKSLNSFYSDFFNSLTESKNLTTFKYVVLRASNSEYIKSWYIEHPKELEKFASFLEKTLQ